MIKLSLKKHIPNIFFLGGIFIIVIIFISYSKDFIYSRKINNEIQTLENKLLTLQTKNLELNKFIKYLDSEAYAEKKARMELGMKKPGESIVVISEDNSQKDKRIIRIIYIITKNARSEKAR